ncbi:arylamine N-acetyltransferase family protein [Marinicrinis sediminis]|uniref:Arylamine N-acetyltransferase n=1 Tax=Marinicrinis sediminis TaxID=1652465 RepID=A0ABW5R5L7_9BACL
MNSLTSSPLEPARLEAYLKRIGVAFQHEAKRQPSVALLRQLHRAHMKSIPFENFRLYEGQPFQLNPVAFLQQALNGEGGLCFEVNPLFKSALEALSFQVSYLSTSFWNESAQTWNPEHSHAALKVDVEGQSWLCDVGTGGVFTYPLPLRLSKPILDPHGHFRFLPLSNESADPATWCLQKQPLSGNPEDEQQWQPEMKVHLEPVSFDVFLPMCRYYEQEPNTRFKQNKLISKVTETGKISLSLHTFTRTDQGHKTKIPLSSLEEWQSYLDTYFGTSSR